MMHTLLAVLVLGQGPAGPPVALDPEIAPLVEHFNAGRGRPRVVALVSSTCGACVFGARAVRQSVLEAWPDADLQVSLVWIDMLPADDAAAAARSSRIFDDPRVKQFHDPAQRVGRVIGAQLLHEDAGPAWDIYLFYGPEAEWTATPPTPHDWYHQLGGVRRADPRRFRTGERTVATLREATGRLIGGEPPPPLEDDIERSAVQFTGAALQVDGLDCEGCPQRAADALATVNGVHRVLVDPMGGLAWIAMPVDGPATVDALIAALAASGFRAERPDPSAVLSIPVELLDDAPPAGKLTPFKAIPTDAPNLEVLWLPDCPNHVDLCTRLEAACERIGGCRIEHVDLTAIAEDDPRLRWGSPTVLVDGKDLFGREPEGEPAIRCRVYADGMPSVDAFVERLERD